jgi:glycosyltransferase involved in cell wall biosynthesis
MGQNGKEFVSKNYDWKKITGKFIELYKTIVK